MIIILVIFILILIFLTPVSGFIPGERFDANDDHYRYTRNYLGIPDVFMVYGWSIKNKNGITAWDKYYDHLLWENRSRGNLGSNNVLGSFASPDPIKGSFYDPTSPNFDAQYVL